MAQQTIAQRYVLNEKIGSGGMGTVYKGLDTQNGLIVAIKELHSHLTDDQLIERFIREGEALRELNHPNIVKMLDAIEEEGQHYLVMEFVSGMDLANLLKQDHLPIDRILNISIDLADALTRAHRLNIIHRDLKPANILIGTDGILRLSDFGVAHVGNKARVTHTDAIVGTIDYLPPEAFDGNQFDERGDIWAFGVILYEMLIGKRPFSGNTMLQMIHAIVNDPIPDIESQREDFPIALVDLIYRMLERNPDARIRSVRQVGLELEDILQGRTSQTALPARFAISESDIFAIKKHNLPVQSTAFVGREPELDELSKLISNPSIRLITIIAPGGMGKTRLSLEAAERSLDKFADGVYFVELAPLSSIDQIIPAIGVALEYKFQQGTSDAKQELLEFLRTKHTLLVMDNFEHLLEGAELVAELLNQTRNIQIMVTSRQRLAQHGENIFHLSGLDFPAWETPEDAMNYAAVKLFMNGAKRANPSFELTSENLDYVSRICKLVQGMPLGILLSGSWLEMLSPEEIATELEQSIDLLSDEVGEFPARQQSIRVVMDYAWRMMNTTEQALFMKLSVFKGGFTQEAAQAVAGANLRILMSLITKSLIRRETETGRYEIHELLRQYAHEKLIESGTVNDVNEQHARYFSGFLASQLSLLKGGGQIKSMSQIDNNYDNMYTAWQWAIEHKRNKLINDMVDSLYLYLLFHDRFDAGYRLFELARRSFTSTDDEALFGRLAIRFIGSESIDIALPILEHSLGIAQKYEDVAEIAFCERELGLLLAHRSALEIDIIDTGINHFETSLGLYRALRDPYFEALVLDDMGWAYQRKGDYAKRIDYSGQSIDLRKQVGDVIGYGYSVAGYAGSMRDSNIAKAFKILEEAKSLGHETGNVYIINMATLALGSMHLTDGNLEKAFEHYQISHQLSQKTKNERWRLTAQFAMANMISLKGENIELAGELLNDVPPENSLIYNDYTVRLHRGLATIVYAARLADSAVLTSDVRAQIKSWKNFGPNSLFVAVLPITIYLFGLMGKRERAIQLLGFSDEITKTVKTISYANHWSVITDFRDSIHKEVGEEAFTALWESGKKLELQDVFNELMQELGG